MKNLVSFLLAFCISLGAQAKEYKFETVPNDPMRTRIYTLDNGLKVYLSVNKEKPRIQTYIAVRTGSRNDPAETTGLAHYLEHLMFKGTRLFGTSNPEKEKPYLDEIEARYERYRKLTNPADRKKAYHEIDSVSQLAARYNIPNEYDKLMSSIGSEGTNAYTNNDVTCYVEDIPSNEVENWARIQADRFQNMVIRGFHTELEAVYEEYNMGLASDNEKAWNALFYKLFPGHPYGTQTTIGTQEHLKNPSIVNIKNYFNRYYVPNNVAICMAGDFNPDEVIPVIERYFGAWKPSNTLSRPEYAPVPELHSPIDTTVIGKEAEFLMLGWKFEGAGKLQNDTLEVLSSILFNEKAGLMDLNLNQPMKVMSAVAFYNAMTDYSTFFSYGYPNKGQTLDEVKQLLLDQIALVKQGKFDESLITAVINNEKLDFNKNLLNNRNRTELMKDAFINRVPWEKVVGRLERLSKITKQDLVSFANRHFSNNYVCVYKKQGEDTTLKKIEKPAITGIPTNRDKSSAFLREIVKTKVAPIKPQFVNFKQDLTFGKIQNGLPVIYKKNTDDDLFTLQYYYEFGTESNPKYSLAANYLDFLGTQTKTVAELKKAFYEIACDFNVSVSSNSISITVSGLNENMPKAVTLAEDLLKNAKPDNVAYNKLVDLIVKVRKDNKSNQRSNYRALLNYGIYGSYNPTRAELNEKELKATTPNELIALIKGLQGLKHTVFYFGPAELQTVKKLISKLHTTPRILKSAPTGKAFVKQPTSVTEVWIAPYEAKNIYMSMYHNTEKQWNAKEAAVAALFNEYFGGGMNTIVFQELRESRGLAYSASAHFYDLVKKGHSMYGTTTIISQNDKLMDCINVFNSILDTIPQNQTAFELAKQGLTKQLESARITRTALFRQYLKAKELGIDYNLNQRIYEALPGVSLDDIVKFEQTYLAQKPYRYLILGDEKELDMKSLEKIGPIKRISTEHIFGDDK